MVPQGLDDAGPSSNGSSDGVVAAGGSGPSDSAPVVSARVHALLISPEDLEEILNSRTISPTQYADDEIISEDESPVRPPKKVKGKKGKGAVPKRK